MSESQRDEGLLEHEASRVLERASEIDAREDGAVSVAELRLAALDAGIPLDAFERALAEVRTISVESAVGFPTSDSSVPALPETRSARVATSLRRAALAALGGGIAWMAYALSGVFGVDLNATLQFSLILAFFSACGMVVMRRPDRDVLNFEFDLASLWVGLTLVWMLFDPTDANAVLAMMGLIGGIAAVVGSILVGRPLPQLPDSSTSRTSVDKLFGPPTGDSF